MARTGRQCTFLRLAVDLVTQPPPSSLGGASVAAAIMKRLKFAQTLDSLEGNSGFERNNMRCRHAVKS